MCCGAWRRIALGPPGAGLGRFVAWKIERRPRGASRGKPAPTFVSGQFLLPPLARAPGVHGWKGMKSISATRDIEWSKQGPARQWFRNDWPETNVGAGLPREAPRGRRSIFHATNLSRRALQILTRKSGYAARQPWLRAGAENHRSRLECTASKHTPS